MVFTEPLTWKCHICGQERPDAAISVLSKPMIINGQPVGQQNIRHCNDKPECIEGAKTFSLFEESDMGIYIDQATSDIRIEGATFHEPQPFKWWQFWRWYDLWQSYRLEKSVRKHLQT